MLNRSKKKRRYIFKSIVSFLLIFSIIFTSAPTGNPLEATVSSTQDTTYPTITTSTSYQNSGNYPYKETDSRGNVTQYTYNTGAGYLTKICDAAGNETSYDVNELNNRLKSVTVDGTGASVNYLYNTDGSVSRITSASNTAYNFTYDSFGRRKQSLMGSRLLSNIVYKDNKTALISSIQYGNNQNKTYEYDDNDQLIAERINGAKISGYTYDKRGRLFKFDDLLSNASTKFTYDLIGRKTAINSSDGQRLSYIYDSNNRVSHSIWSLGNEALDTWYVYGDGTSGKRKNAIYSVNLNARPQLLYTYDPLCILSTRTINTQSVYVTEYEYLSGSGENSTTNLVSKLKNGADTFEYTYDALGNITEIKKNGTILESYIYDSLNQLKSVTRNGVTTEYTYSGGNVTQVKTGGTTVKSYTYGDSEWHDLLTVYNGQQITYDSIGNPLTYRDGYSFNWSSGRQLTWASNGSNSYSYQYDATGQRISKTVNGTQTQYYWLDGLLRAERTGNSYITYLYDENGSPYGFLLGGITSGVPYYYIKNLQGDVTGILDSMGNEVVQYTYDEWGKCLSVTGSQASYIGQINSIRYRGYYYDTETGFYYLDSRYYDPEIGRFINADGYISTGQGILGSNMFAYCNNNPVMLMDNLGTRPIASTSIRNETSFERSISCAHMKGYDLDYYSAVYQKRDMLNTLGFENITNSSAKDYYDTITSCEINTPILEAHFLAQCAKESDFGRGLTEYGSMSYFAGQRYGYKYRGAGYIQLTWDYNYRDFANAMNDAEIYYQGADYVAANYAWQAAGWFWQNKKMNAGILSGATVRDITKKVRGNDGTWQERQAYYNAFLGLLS